MKKIMTSAMALVLLLCAGSIQALCQQDSCYDSCCDSCVSCDPCCSNDAWYIGGFAGANWLTGSKHHGGCFSGKHKYDTGYALAISAGRTFCNGLRAEFEYIYRENQVKNHNNCNVCAPHKGHLRSNSYMVNGLWDISFCNDLGVKPFVGLGIGYADQRLKFNQSNTFICDNGNKKKSGFAWQVIAGLDYPICDFLDISVQYRFYQGHKNFYSQNLGAGLRYNF